MYNQPVSAMPPIAPQAPMQSSLANPSMATSAADKVFKGVKNSLVKTIVIILLSLLLIGALLLSVYFYNEYESAQDNVDSKIAAAVVDAQKEITDKLEEEFAEREKEPNSNFAGPDDYGRVGFKYPKTWSVYIAKDAVKGGDFEAYLHPAEVPPIANNAIFALRVTIRSESFESADSRYKGLVTSGKLASSTIAISTTTGNRYDGILPNNLIGSIVIFKIRDKVVTLETDAEIYRNDFDKILKTVTFNE